MRKLVKPSFDIGKIKTFYFILALVLSVFIGFLIVIPQVIPSWEIVQEILVGILYIINIVLVYTIIKRIQIYSKPKVSKKQAAYITMFASFFFVTSIIILFIFTSFGFGQGFMGAELEREIKYPKHNTSIYIYDAGFLDPATAIKIKSGYSPFMKDVKFLGNWIPYKVKESYNGDIAQLFFERDTIKISLKTGELISD